MKGLVCEGIETAFAQLDLEGVGYLQGQPDPDAMTQPIEDGSYQKIGGSCTAITRKILPLLKPGCKRFAAIEVGSKIHFEAFDFNTDSSWTKAVVMTMEHPKLADRGVTPPNLIEALTSHNFVYGFYNSKNKNYTNKPHGSSKLVLAEMPDPEKLFTRFIKRRVTVRGIEPSWQSLVACQESVVTANPELTVHNEFHSAVV